MFDIDSFRRPFTQHSKSVKKSSEGPVVRFLLAHVYRAYGWWRCNSKTRDQYGFSHSFQAQAA